MSEKEFQKRHAKAVDEFLADKMCDEIEGVEDSLLRKLNRIEATIQCGIYYPGQNFEFSALVQLQAVIKDLTPKKQLSLAV